MKYVPIPEAESAPKRGRGELGEGFVVYPRGDGVSFEPPLEADPQADVHSRPLWTLRERDEKLGVGESLNCRRILVYSRS